MRLHVIWHARLYSSNLISHHFLFTTRTLFASPRCLPQHSFSLALCHSRALLPPCISTLFFSAPECPSAPLHQTVRLPLAAPLRTINCTMSGMELASPLSLPKRFASLNCHLIHMFVFQTLVMISLPRLATALLRTRNYLWAVPAREGRLRNRVIRVVPQQKSDNSSWEDDIYHSSDSECGEIWRDVDLNVDGCGLGCLAVVVGELSIEGASDESEFHYIPLTTHHSCSQGCWQKLHMIYPREFVPRLVVVRMLNARRDELHVLTGRNKLNEACTIRALNSSGDEYDLIAFYNEFWDVPVSDQREDRKRQIWENIFKFCRGYKRTHFGSGYKTANLLILDSKPRAEADDGNDGGGSSPGAFGCCAARDGLPARRGRCNKYRGLHLH